MKVSEAIDRLEVGDTVWVKLEVYKIDCSEFPLGASGESASVCWFNGEQEISLTEPTPLNSLAQEYDVEPGTIREWLDVGHKGSFEKEAPRYQYPIKTMPALIADITHRKNLAKVALDKLDKEMYTTPIMRLAQQKYEIYSNVVKLLNDLEPVEQAEKVEARLAEHWHEDIGPVLWWNFPVEEPPYCGTPLDEHFPKYKTHFSTIDMPTEIEKPKRWVVKYKPAHHSSGEWYFIGFVGGDATLKPNCASHVDCKTVIKFTDRAKAEAVATLVEGSVEEV